MKKTNLKVLMSVIFIVIFTYSIFAADGPTIVPADTYIEIYGDEATSIKYDITHRYENEYMNILIHTGEADGTVVKTIKRNYNNKYINYIKMTSEYTININAGDLQPGKYVVEAYMTYYRFNDWCENDTHAYTELIIKCPSDEHNFDEGTVIKEANCYYDGELQRTCKSCGDCKVEVIPATGQHKYNSFIVDIQPTCEQSGSMHFKCEVCRRRIVEELPMSPHNYELYNTTAEPSCNQAGRAEYRCTDCKLSKFEELPALPHTYELNKVLSKATASINGEIEYKCKACGHINIDTIPSVFTDVESDAYFSKAVDWAYSNEITKGVSATEFAPNSAATRAAVVTFLWRANGSPAHESAINPFTDVSENSWYYDAVMWAVENNITAGKKADEFAPDDNCTYAHILTFIWRAIGKPNVTNDGNWYDDPVNWAKNANLISDTRALDDLFAVCPRSDIVTYLYRTNNL